MGSGFTRQYTSQWGDGKPFPNQSLLLSGHRVHAASPAPAVPRRMRRQRAMSSDVFARDHYEREDVARIYGQWKDLFQPKKCFWSSTASASRASGHSTWAAAAGAPHLGCTRSLGAISASTTRRGRGLPYPLTGVRLHARECQRSCGPGQRQFRFRAVLFQWHRHHAAPAAPRDPGGGAARASR